MNPRRRELPAEPPAQVVGLAVGLGRDGDAEPAVLREGGGAEEDVGLARPGRGLEHHEGPARLDVGEDGAERGAAGAVEGLLAGGGGVHRWAPRAST